MTGVRSEPSHTWEMWTTSQTFGHYLAAGKDFMIHILLSRRITSVSEHVQTVKTFLQIKTLEYQKVIVFHHFQNTYRSLPLLLFTHLISKCFNSYHNLVIWIWSEIIVIKSGLSNLYFIIIRGIENDVLFLNNFKEELEMTWNFTICAENTCMTTAFQ